MFSAVFRDEKLTFFVFEPSDDEDEVSEAKNKTRNIFSNKT